MASGEVEGFITAEFPAGTQSLPGPAEAMLDRFIVDAQVIGVGESAHGSAGFIHARRDLVMHLIEAREARLLLFENDVFRFEPVSEWIAACASTPEMPAPAREEALRRALLGTHAKTDRSVEFAALLRAVCGFNQAHPEEPVAAHGIDVFDDPWTLRGRLSTSTSAEDPKGYERALGRAIESCYLWRVTSMAEAPSTPEWQELLVSWRLDPELKRTCVGALISMTLGLEAPAEGEESREHREARWASRLANVAVEYRDFYMVDLPRALALREQAQAEMVVAWTKLYPGTRAVFLAHNVHVAKAQSRVLTRNPSRSQWYGARSTGEHLDAHFGQGYRAIAISGYEVESSRDGVYPLPTRSDSLDLQLASRCSRCLVELGRGRVDEGGRWWLHSEGDGDGMLLVPKEQYDGLVFVKVSPGAKPLTVE